LRVAFDVTLNYLISVPDEYSPTGEPFPLLLFLHGSGERGPMLDSVKKHGPPKLVDRWKKFPFILISPQCADDEMWFAPELVALLDHIEQTYNVDRAREYVTGLSIGGHGTWTLAILQPHRFAAIAPVCGWGDINAVGILKDTPVWAFHGMKDRAVKFSESESMIRVLQEAGGDARLTAYPKAGHDSWTKTYKNPELYSWLLSHRRSNR
jgi:predicted peptidase